MNCLLDIGILKRKQVNKINDEYFTNYKSARYKIPLIIPYVSFVVFLLARFPKLHVKYKIGLISVFTVLIFISHYRWKHINNGYHSI